MSGIRLIRQQTPPSASEKSTWRLNRNRKVIFAVGAVCLVGCIGAGFELLHLIETGNLTYPFRVEILVLIAFLSVAAVVAIASRGRLMTMVSWAIFVGCGAHLFSIIAIALFVLDDVGLAVRHALWLTPVQIFFYATLRRSTATILSLIMVFLSATMLGAYFTYNRIDVLADESSALMVHLFLIQLGCIILLGGISVFREAAIEEGARAEVLADTADALKSAADKAEADRRTAIDALSRAEAATRSREAFLATMSHELRTPLNAIIGFSQLLEMGIGAQPLEGKQKEYAADIHHSGEHMLTLVNQLLEFSRLDSGEGSVEFQTYSLSAIVDSTLRMMHVLSEKKSICLEQDWDPDDIFAVETDDQAIRQILVNLVSNAVKFTGEGGRVTVSLTHGPGGTASLEVADTGIGIPEDMLGTICDPFVQVGDPSLAQVSGTGLGLSIVSKLSALIGGELEIKSREGEGTRVRITLPAVPPQLETSPENERMFG